MQAITTNRHHFLDNLKIVLIMLVIAHHAGQPYGGSGGWWYVTDSQQPASLGHFFTVNASFFMGLFFFISAYFLPASIDKKGKKRFLQDRLKRLGWPLLFGVALLIPVLMYIFHLHYRGYPAVSFWSYYKTYYLGMTAEPAHWIGPAWPDLNFGHLWFIENLLFYSLVYLLCTLVMKTKKAAGTAAHPAPTHTGIVVFAAALSFVTFIVRIWFPIDRWIGLFGFIQMEVAHIPQYISFFVLGIMAYRRNWLQQLSARTGKVWLAVGVTLAVLCYLGFAPAIQGSLSLRAFIYPFYEAFECTGLIIGLLYLFRTFFNTSSSLSKSLAQNTYAVYIIHIPVLVAFQYAFLHVALSGYVKFFFVSLLGIVFSFLLSHFMFRKIPYVRNIL